MSFEDRVCAEIPHLRRYARALCGDVARADDLVQDCLERALRKRHLWRPAGRLRAWLFRMLYRIYLNQCDSAANRRESTHPDPAAGQATAARGETQVFCREVLSAVDRLPNDQRIALLMVALEGFTYREAAQILDIRIGTLRSRLARGRETVRRHLQLEDGRADSVRLRRIK